MYIYISRQKDYTYIIYIKAKKTKNKTKKVCAYMYSHELFWCVRTYMLSYFGHVRLYNCMDCSLPGSSVDGILQARVLEWVAMPCSRGST